MPEMVALVEMIETDWGCIQVAVGEQMARFRHRFISSWREELRAIIDDSHDRLSDLETITFAEISHVAGYDTPESFSIVVVHSARRCLWMFAKQ